jgi:CheY-like chemotaxis protein
MSDTAVLIVDDDPDCRDLVRLIVESTGARAFEAATCREAITVLARERSQVRLVLLDYFMPGMEPPACARTLSELAGTTNVVLCTAALDPAGRAAELGLTRWLAKPFTVPQLERLVHEAMAAR